MAIQLVKAEFKAETDGSVKVELKLSGAKPGMVCEPDNPEAPQSIQVRVTVVQPNNGGFDSGVLYLTSPGKIEF
ncbi:MAG: hypothetical protein CVU78_01930 [Elusimicrobia bacterium HGW-Elusimicrobia-2]|nr:MAG: hypothetical protein CVU78_01930 [Elusimicrobia bacterium HGW-Elusimicrobia-2]